jgi:hypothetical protein
MCVSYLPDRSGTKVFHHFFFSDENFGIVSTGDGCTAGLYFENTASPRDLRVSAKVLAKIPVSQGYG